jgi:hypothetical protein
LFWDREEVESRFNLHPLQVQALRGALTVDPDLSIADLSQALNARNPYVVSALCAVVVYRAREIIADPDAKAQIVETLASRIHMEFPRSGVINWFPEDRLLTGGTGPSDYFDIIHLPASRAIASIAPRHRDAVAAHIHQLQSVDPRERLRAAMHLGAMGEAGEAGVKPLCESTRDADRRVALSAVTALGMIGPSAKWAVPTLEVLAAHREPAFSRRAKAALKSIGLQRDDTWRFWHRTGFKESEGRLVDGKAEGHWIFWYRNGHKRAEGDFHKGVYAGSWTFWDVVGRLQKKGSMKDGVGDGYWEFPRQPWRTGVYKDGVRVSVRRSQDGAK